MTSIPSGLFKTNITFITEIWPQFVVEIFSAWKQTKKAEIQYKSRPLEGQTQGWTDMKVEIVI